jgi:hypothetical protein
MLRTMNTPQSIQYYLTHEVMPCAKTQPTQDKALSNMSYYVGTLVKFFCGKGYGIYFFNYPGAVLLDKA